jgi:hypothetical protein
MNRLALAGIFGVAAFLACGANGNPPNGAQRGTPCIPAQPTTGPIDEWSLWTGPTQLRGANTWQKRLTNRRGDVWPAYTQENLSTLATWGANYVNLSIPGPRVERADRQGRYAWDTRAWTNLEAMVSCAEQAGLFVVVSFRTGPGRSEYVFDTTERPKTIHLWEKQAAQDAWVEMWGRTAELLRNRSAVVGYDLMVEPLLESENPRTRFVAEDWYRLAERLVDAIRNVDPVTPILVSVAPGGSPHALAALDTSRFDPSTRHILFTVHQYAPWTYTHQPTKHSSFDCDTPSIGNGDDTVPMRPFDPSVRSEMRTVYEQVRKWKNDKGIILAVNEFGVTRWVDSAEVFIREQMEEIERISANHALWLWDPAACLGWDAMNFRNGPDSTNHVEDPNSALADSIRSAWRRNTVRLP